MGNNVQLFFKENKKTEQNEFYIASERFKDEDGKPVRWELRHIPTRRMEDIKERCGFYSDTDKIMGKFAIESVIAAVVFPPLRDQNLQDSYGVKKPEDLLYELLNPAELDMLKVKVLYMNGYGEDFGDLVGEAKNS